MPSPKPLPPQPPDPETPPPLPHDPAPPPQPPPLPTPPPPPPPPPRREATAESKPDEIKPLPPPPPRREATAESKPDETKPPPPPPPPPPPQKLAQSVGCAADGADDAIIPTAFEKFIVKYSCYAFWFFFGIALSMVLMCFGMLAGGVVEFTTDTVWDVRGDNEVEKAHAFMKIKASIDLPQLDSGVEPTERSQPLTQLMIIYEVKSGNVFDPSNQEKMKQVEGTLLTFDKWADRCMLVYSNGTTPRCAGGYSALSFTHTGPTVQTQDFQNGFGPCRGDPLVAAQCMASPFSVGRQPCVSRMFNPVISDVALDSDYETNLRCMCCAFDPGSSGCSAIAAACGNNDNTVLCGRTMRRAQSATRRNNIGIEFSCSSGEALRARSVYFLGLPVDGEANNDAVLENIQPWIDGELLPELMEARLDVKTDNFDVYFIGDALLDQFVMGRLVSDQMLACGAFVIVFMWIWVGTGSAFLALCGMIEIVFSIPMAGFVWGVFQMKFISFFMLSIVFLILGIGADDIFVIWDAYMQSYKIIDDTEEDFETKRFAYALRRARCAMLVTSFSTFCGFLACGVSPIPSMSAFGIFGAFVVIFDFFMVITFFASAMVVYTRYFMKSSCQPCSRLRSCIGEKCSGGAQTSDVAAEEEEDKLRPVEQFFHARVSYFVDKYSLIIAIFWLILGSAGLLTTAVLLRPSKKAPNILVDAYGKRMIELQTTGFLASEGEERIRVYLVLGLNAEEPIDRTGTNYQDPKDTGVPVFDAGSIASLNAPSGQLSLWNLCEQARNSFSRVSKDSPCTTRIVNNVRVEDGACMPGAVCFIDWVRDYRIEVQGSTAANWHEREDLYTTLSGPAFTGGPDVADAFRTNMGFDCPEGCCDNFGWYLCLMYVVRTQNGLRFNEWRSGTQWVIEGDALKIAWVEMNSTLPLTSLPFAEILPYFNDWDNFVEGNKGSLSGPVQICDMWIWMVTQREILSAVFQSIGSCLALAWLILVAATTNWMIASIALACILEILFLCGGAISAAGWSLGIFEAIGLIVVIGLAVDYSVHMCHAYNECRLLNGAPATRFQKTQHALTEMGVSVVSGAATTFFASLFLIGATFTFYYVFGIFMLMTVIWSLAVSLTMLPALLCIFGPEGSRGDIVFIRTLAGKLSGKLGGILWCTKK